MIDRKTLGMAGAYLTIMLAAAIWRIALLPDWTLSPVPSGNVVTHSYKLISLFLGPLWLVVFTGLLLLRRWLFRNPKEELRSWQSQGELMLLFCGAIVTATQLIRIAWSLGAAHFLDPIAVTRASFVLIGALLIVLGNQLPKLPWPQLRIKLLALDPIQGTKLLRFNGWIIVLVGIGTIVFASTLPISLLRSVMPVMIFGFFGLTILRRVQLKRAPLG